MALKLTLKPHERLVLGGAVVRNGNAKCDLVVENTVPVLRDKDILRPEEADTPCKRVYLVIQLMYVDGEHLAEHHATYWQLVRELVAAAPSTRLLLRSISEEILAGRHYQALKSARQLIAYEEEAVSHVRSAAGNL